MLLHYDEFASPIGRILFASDGEAICALDFEDYLERMKSLLGRRFPRLVFQRHSDPQNLKDRLQSYFDGDVFAMEPVRVNTAGSAFQEEVWKTLRTIPAAETWTYGQLANRIGRPQAARAVGRANSLNPVAIIVPCHRVIGASSALTGYAGGLERKRWLLDHERAAVGRHGSEPLAFNDNLVAASSVGSR
jgi:methylated-DNA-[protein]-cysteine S-methyltransferase